MSSGPIELYDDAGRKAFDGQVVPPIGGALPDPITSTVNIQPADAFASALAIVAAALSNALQVSSATHDGSVILLRLVNDTGQVLTVSDSGATALTLGPGSDFSIANAAAAIADFADFGGEARIGFFGAGAVAQPVVPATLPAVQDVIDALVSLGLVIQSD